MAITAICTAITAWTPTFDSDTVLNTRAYNAQLDSLNEAEAPVRFIGKNDEKQRAEIEIRNLGNRSVATWEILDRAYLFPVMLDQGIKNYNHKILDYIDSYMTVAQAGQCLSSDVDGIVVNVSFEYPYTEPYPEIDGAPEYWVVDALVTVEEYR